MTDQLSSLIQAVEDADSSSLLLEAVQNLAAARLEGAIPVLIVALSYNNPGAAVSAVDGLIQLGEPAVSPLTLATSQAKVGVSIQGRYIRIPGLGKLLVKGLDTRLPKGVRTATLSICKVASGDYLQLGVELPEVLLPDSDLTCGVDVGVEYLYATDHGRLVEPPSYFKQSAYTSRDCPRCGHRNQLDVNQWIFCCEQCGYQSQRKHAAANVIHQSAVFARSYRGCHRDVMPMESPLVETMKQESQLEKVGTVPTNEQVDRPVDHLISQSSPTVLPSSPKAPSNSDPTGQSPRLCLQNHREGRLRGKTISTVPDCWLINISPMTIEAQFNVL